MIRTCLRKSIREPLKILASVFTVRLELMSTVNPAPPGLLPHPRVPGGGLITPPAISRTRGESCEAAFENSPQDAPETLKRT